MQLCKQGNMSSEPKLSCKKHHLRSHNQLGHTKLTEKKYIGLCESTFKKRFANHKSSFNHERYKNSTSLSVELWKAKEANGTPSVSWRILKNAKAYTPESKRCLLCLNEKFEIANYHDKNLLNKRAEIIAKCRHRRKHLLLLHNPDDNT